MRRALLAAVLLLPGSPPDLLLPGHKDVRHELVFAWAGPGPMPILALSPLRSLHGHALVREGEPMRFSSKYGTRLWLLPAAPDLPPSESLRDQPWPSFPLPLREVRSVPQSHPLARLVTSVRIASRGKDELALEVVGERRYDHAGREIGPIAWVPLLALSLAGAAWLYRLARHQPPAEAA